jgi:hypothetical protein
LSRSRSSRGWRVIDRGINDQPFLWKKGTRDMFVMIDIFNPDSLKRCYSVLVLHGDPSKNETRKEIVGIACADESEGGWVQAYVRARNIAEQFMANA